MSGCPKQVKSVANMTKKGYNEFIEKFRGRLSDMTPDTFEDIIQDCLRESIGFDPNIKRSPDVCKKLAEQRKQRLEKEGTTQYDKYSKLRYTRLKEQYPGISTTVLTRVTLSNLQKLVDTK